MEELIVEILAEVKKMREKIPEDAKISVSDILLMIDKAGDERKIRAKIKEKVEMDSKIEAVYNEASKVMTAKKCEDISELIEEIVDKYFSKFVGKINSPYRLIISNIGNDGSIVEVQISSNTSSHKFQAKVADITKDSSPHSLF